MKPKILYVDDEPQNLISFKASFREYFDIAIFNSAAEGLDFLKKEPFNSIQVIISDQRMPGTSGDEFFTQIPIPHQHATRILLTAYTDIDSAKKALNNGNISFFFNKPFDVDSLKKALDQACNLFIKKVQLESEVEEIKNISKQQIRGLIHDHVGSKELLSEELHEELAQELSGLKFFLHSLEESKDSPDFPNLVRRINNTLDESITNIRNICLNIMPRSVKNYGFEGGLIELVRKFNTDQKLNIKLVKSEFPQLSSESNFIIYDIFETILNRLSSFGMQDIEIEVRGNLTLMFKSPDNISQWEISETILSKIEAYHGEIKKSTDRLEIRFQQLS